MTKRLSDHRLMQIKENLLHGTFVYTHGLDLLDHCAALEAELANTQAILRTTLASRDAAIAELDRLSRELATTREERDRYREALEWYASIDYVTHEWGRCSVGDRARQALEGGAK